MKTNSYIIKLVLMSSLLILGLFINLKFQLSLKNKNRCLKDTVLNIFENERIFLKNSKLLTFIILTINSICLDSYAIFFIFYKIIYKGEYIFYSVGLLIFYVIRYYVQQLIVFPIPNLFNFNNSFPSIFILYGKMNDLYYSGHTGITFYFYLNTIFQNDSLAYKIISLLLHIMTVITLIFTSVHYINDIIIAYILSFSLYYLNHQYIYVIKATFYSLWLNCKCLCSYINYKLKNLLKKLKYRFYKRF